MFFGKTPPDASTETKALDRKRPSVRLEISFPLVRHHRDQLPNQREWLNELPEVVDSLPDLVATFDRDGRLLLVNAAGIDLLGHSQQTLTVLLLTDLYAEADAERIVDQALQQALTDGSWSGCAPLRHADGRPIEAHQRWVAHKLHETKARAFTLIARPLPESCNDAELRNRRESLAAMSLGFVHDLNNVLGPIAAYADLASSVVGADDAAARYLENIAAAAELGRGLTTRLTALAREREPKRSVVDLSELAHEIVRWLRVSRPDLDIQLERDDNVVTTVIGDPVQLQQVVLNLARNAGEALSDRAGSIRVRIDHAQPPQSKRAHEGNYVRLGVHDDGRGIHEAAEARLFEPFFSTRADGSGLGLNVSREIVRAHDGIITVEPGEPSGTRATLYLPLWDPATASDEP